MEKKYLYIVLWSFLFLLLVACGNEKSTDIKPTPYAQQTVEVTRIGQQVVTLPALNKPSSRPKLLVTNSPILVQGATKSIELNTAYFDGSAVIGRYYTLLNYGLYDEIPSLFSSTLLQKIGGKYLERNIKSVRVRSIYPYSLWQAETGLPIQNIPDDELRFIVGITMFHEGAGWNPGGTPQPDEQTRFISLVFESNEWKIDEINSSPWLE
jgi:hypothetical protein